jgi:MFS family permease
MTTPLPAPPDDALALRVARNPALLCVHHALMMTLFPMAVLTLFQHEQLGLSVAEVMLVQAAFGGALAVFEFPSCYLADRIGYRPTMIVASILSIAAWSLYSVASDFSGVVLAEVLMGLGISLVSGTNSAMLYESLANRGDPERFAHWFGRARFFAQMAEGSAALVAGLLFAISVRLPFYLMVAVWVVNLGVALLLVEPRYARHSVQRPLAHMRSLITFVARRAPRLRALFAVGIVIGLSSFIPVWLVALYARDSGVPVSWIGPIWAIANYSVALGSLMSPRLSRRAGTLPIMLGCIGLIALGYFGMGLTHAWWGFAFYFAFNLSRGISAPILAQAEQEEIPSGDRASLVSMRSLLFRAGFIALGPLAGFLIDRHGQHGVLLGLGFLLVGLALATCALLARHRTSNAAAIVALKPDGAQDSDG